MASLPPVLEADADPGTLAKDEVSGLWHKLSTKQQEWLREYLTNGLNAQDAALAAYQTNDNDSAASIGYDNKNHPRIRRLIEHACRRHMSENEALQRLSSFARVTFDDFVSFGEDGTPEIDLQKAKERGVMHHIKEIKMEENEVTGDTYVADLKLRDPVKPNMKLLKALGAFDNDDGEGPTNVTFKQWIGKLEKHTSTERWDESPWPEVEGDPEQMPAHQRPQDA
jgi:hypothetical protein